MRPVALDRAARKGRAGLVLVLIWLACVLIPPSLLLYLARHST